MGIAGDFVLIVVAGFVGGLLARVLRLPLLVGYVAAGVAVGPNTPGPIVSSGDDIGLLAEIGVALLLFALGLEVSLRDLRPVRRIALIGGPIQIAVTWALGWLIVRRLADVPSTEAVWFGAMVSLSSTMVVLKMLLAAGTSTTLASRVMLGLLVVQDLAVVPMLIVLPQLGAIENAGDAVLRAMVVAAVFLVAMIAIGTRVLPALLRRVLVWGSRELFLVSVVAAGVGIGYVTYRLGLSFALGAFVAGIVLSESELSHQALSDVVPLRDVFGLVFFVSVGMLFDPQYAFAHAALVVPLVAAVIVGKALVCGLLARAFGYIFMAPWLVGLGLAQVGEFSFVLARSGRGGGFLSQDTYDLALTCTVLTMTLSPAVFAAAGPLGRAWARWRKPPPRPVQHAGLPTPSLHDHVVVAGYGRTGRAVVTALAAAGVPVAVIELNHGVLGGSPPEALAAIWGDISSEEVLGAAGVRQARMFVVAVPDWNAARLSIERAKRLNPQLFVVARATTLPRLDDLRRLGVDAVVQPESEGGVEMMRQVLGRLERSQDEIERVTRDLRQTLYAAPAAVAAGD
jgi:CPA2 family monovalent cation:H+ antiporter-2